MVSYLKFCFRHAFRSRFLVLILALSLGSQVLGLKILKNVTISLQGVISTLSGSQVVFVALLIQLFSGAFCAAVYGIWLVPYSHVGTRSLLTHTLPLPRWKMVLSYLVTFALFFFIQEACMLATLIAIHGRDVFETSTLAFSGTARIFILHLLAFQTLCLLLATGSAVFGQIPTIIVSCFILIVLQVVGSFFRFNVSFLESFQMDPKILFIKNIYEKLPPFGHMIFDMREAFFKGDRLVSSITLWGVWLVLSLVLFLFMIRRPRITRQTDG